MKNFPDVGPMYHLNDAYSGHVFVRVLAYLFGQEVQVMYRDWWEQRKPEVAQLANDVEREQQPEELQASKGERIHSSHYILWTTSFVSIIFSGSQGYGQIAAG